MPVAIEQIYPDLFMLEWRDKITFEEVYESHEQTTHLTQQIGIERYIHVIDMAKMSSFPPNVARGIKIFQDHPNVFAVFVVNIPPAMRVMVNVVDQLMPNVILEHVDTIDTALQKAEHLLEKERG